MLEQFLNLAVLSKWKFADWINQQERLFILNMIEKAFVLKNNNSIFNSNSKNFKFFLAGLIESEGSLCVSIKKHNTARFGYIIDVEFFLHQHVSCKPILEAAKNVFGTGNICLKSGFNDVYTYSVTNRKTIAQKVIPYFKKYVIPYSCKFIFLTKYERIVRDLELKRHYELKTFIELLELSYDLNSKKKNIKAELDILKNNILRDYTPKESTL